MDLCEAWRILGRDLPAIMANAKSRRRDERLPYLESLVKEAERTKRDLQVKHHPDRGGDPDMFKRASLAFEVVEKALEDFRVKFQESEEKRRADRESKRSVFIAVDPLK